MYVITPIDRSTVFAGALLSSEPVHTTVQIISVIVWCAVLSTTVQEIHKH